MIIPFPETAKPLGRLQRFYMCAETLQGALFISLMHKPASITNVCVNTLRLISELQEAILFVKIFFLHRPYSFHEKRKSFFYCSECIYDIDTVVIHSPGTFATFDDQSQSVIASN
jgi:hypothetical protein